MPHSRESEWPPIHSLGSLSELSPLLLSLHNSHPPPLDSGQKLRFLISPDSDKGQSCDIYTRFGGGQGQKL